MIKDKNFQYITEIFQRYDLPLEHNTLENVTSIGKQLTAYAKILDEEKDNLKKAQDSLVAIATSLTALETQKAGFTAQISKF